MNMYLLALGFHFPITKPAMIIPDTDEILLINGPANPEVEALLRNTNSVYFDGKPIYSHY